MSDYPTVLVIEDGDEYLETLSKFVPGPRYVQAHHAAEAMACLAQHRVDVIYLDMRFDRIDPENLVGNLGAVAARHGHDLARARRHLANHQGLYILDALSRAGHSQIPVILAYDFSQEQVRFAHLLATHPNLTWVPDAVRPEEIRARIERLVRR